MLNLLNNIYVPNYFVLLAPNNFVLPPIHFYLQIIKTQAVLTLITTTSVSLLKPSHSKNSPPYCRLCECMNGSIDLTRTDILVRLIQLA